MNRQRLILCFLIIMIILFTVRTKSAAIQIKQGTTTISSGSRAFTFNPTDITVKSEQIIFSIHNNDSTDLDIDSVSISNTRDFILDNSTTRSRILPGKKSEFSITFYPGDSGERETRVIILSNAPDIPVFTFTIAGEGVETRGIVNIDILETAEKQVIDENRTLKDLDAYATTKRWAIVIGINNYEDKFISNLSKAQNDAKVLSNVLVHEGQFDHVFLFTDDQYSEHENYPSLNNIIAKMEFLKQEIQPNDTLLFSFSGHGISDDEGRSYLLLADTVISHPYKTSLPLRDVSDWISALRVKKNIVFLDACRNVVEKTKGAQTRRFIAEQNAQVEVSAVVYATSPGEFSYEHNKEPYGVFTAFMIQGLKGAADANNDVLVTFNELRNYVEQEVKDWAIQYNKKQKPYTSITGEFHGDVVLSVIPIKERAKFNPNLIKNSYKKRLTVYQALNYSSLSLMISGFVGAGIGAIVGGAGYSQYSKLTAASPFEDWQTYRSMQSYGFTTAIVFAAIGGVSLIPFIVSFAVKPRIKTNRVMLDLRFNRGNSIALGVCLKL